MKLNFNFRCQNFYTIQLSLLGGKVSEWKVQKLTLHIQMFNKFDNFFLLWHFYYTCILDCFTYIFIFSCSHISQTSGWLPPADSWDSGGGLNLPYGWEAAQDQEGKTYYVKWVHFFISLLVLPAAINYLPQHTMTILASLRVGPDPNFPNFDQ